jgi:prolyl-tRNA synthetase
MCAEKIKYKKEENIIEWYNTVLTSAEVADFSSVKGFTVYRPYGYRMWEILRDALDYDFKAEGVQNSYFPLLIPEKLLKKEKEHVEGFAPEVAWVTKGGNAELEEKLAIRPTSETIMYESYSKWIKSYRDLPLLLNQWNTVVRWEIKDTRLFLRGKEVLWQEGHCAFATNEEAERNAEKMIRVYAKIVREVLAVPSLVGMKSESERFAGAVKSYTIETFMPNNYALQCGTSHNLGQNFSKSFDIKFLDEKNEWHHVFQTSWGLSMRALGAMFMLYGDDRGLVLPPNVAPTQVVIVPILGKNDEEILKVSAKIVEELKKEGLRVLLDDRTNYTAGWKFNEYELKGVPVRIDVGQKEVASGEIKLKIRFTSSSEIVSLERLKEVKAVLNRVQKDMLESSERRLARVIKEERDKESFITNVSSAAEIAKVAWCGRKECEAGIKEKTKAVSRAISIEGEKLIDKKCIFCGRDAVCDAYFSQSY